MKSIAWMIREIFQDAESARSGHSHVAVNQRFSHLFKILANAKPFSGSQAAPAFGTTHGVSGNFFANPTASSSALYPQESNPWISNVSEHTSPPVMSESPTPNTAFNQRCQSGPSAKNSIIPSD